LAVDVLELTYCKSCGRSVGVFEFDCGEADPAEWAVIRTPYGGMGLEDAGGVPMLCRALRL